MIPPDTRGGGVLEGASPETLGCCSVVQCLFQERLGGGGSWASTLGILLLHYRTGVEQEAFKSQRLL